MNASRSRRTAPEARRAVHPSGHGDWNAVTFDSDSTTCCNSGALYQLGGTATLTNTTVVELGRPRRDGRVLERRRRADARQRHVPGRRADIATDRLGLHSRREHDPRPRLLERGACEQAGDDDELNNETTGAAITTPDGGHNIDQDASCNLSGTGGQSKADPMLVPIFDNGGPTPTEALIAGSPALGDPATTNCPDDRCAGRVAARFGSATSARSRRM